MSNLDFGTISKKENKSKIQKTNCYICSKSLLLEEAKRNPNDDSDTRYFCKKDYKKLFGKKKKLIKRV